MHIFTWQNLRSNQYLLQAGTSDLWIGTPDQLIVRAGLHRTSVASALFNTSRLNVTGFDDENKFFQYVAGEIRATSMAVMTCRECEGQRGLHSGTCSVFLEKVYH